MGKVTHGVVMLVQSAMNVALLRGWDQAKTVKKLREAADFYEALLKQQGKKASAEEPKAPEPPMTPGATNALAEAEKMLQEISNTFNQVVKTESGAPIDSLKLVDPETGEAQEIKLPPPTEGGDTKQ